MESRTELRSNGTEKSLVVMLVVSIVLALGIMAALLANSVIGPTPTQTTVTTQSGAGSSEPVDSFDGSGHGFIP